MKKASREVGIRRLETLVKYVSAEVKPSKLNMWLYAELVDEDHERPMCGTPACMLGHATNVPSLRRAGLRLVTHDSDPEQGIVVLRNPSTGQTVEPDPLGAAAVVFGLDYNEAYWLFRGSSNSKKEVLADFRSFIKNAKKELAAA